MTRADVDDVVNAVPSWLDVVVEFGRVPEQLPDGTKVNEWLSVTDDRALVTMPTGTRLLATSDRLVVQRTDETTRLEVAYLLYSWGTRLVLSLRREFSLHASAIAHEGRAIALIGQSHAGKSTTLLGLRGRGYQAIVDDLLAVRFAPDSTTATCSGWPRPVHVRARTLENMPEWNDAPTMDERVRPDLPRLAGAVTEEVRDVPLAFAVQLRVARQISTVSVEPISGAVKLALIKATVDRFGQSSFGGRDADFFTWAAGVADRVPMYRLTRPADGWSLDEVLDKIEDLLERDEVDLTESGSRSRHPDSVY